MTESEKAAAAARALGFTATTSVGGCKAADKTDWRPLAGKEVWILPDNDAPGRAYADTVADILLKRNPSAVVKVVELPGLPERGDLGEWIAGHGDAAELALSEGKRHKDPTVEPPTKPDCQRPSVSSNQQRQAIDDSGLKLDQIAKATAIGESALAKFYHVHRGLSMDALNALGAFLQLTITLGRKPASKGE